MKEYKDIRDKADDLGDLIAKNILADYDDPKMIRDDMDEQITESAKRMTDKARSYIQRRLTWAVKV